VTETLQEYVSGKKMAGLLSLALVVTLVFHAGIPSKFPLISICFALPCFVP